MTKEKYKSRPIVWLKTEIKTPPFSDDTRIEIGRLFRDLQEYKQISFPDSRPMPSIGQRCHELRVYDLARKVFWRIIYRLDLNAVVVVLIFEKKTNKTPQRCLELAKQRLKLYDSI